MITEDIDNTEITEYINNSGQELLTNIENSSEVIYADYVMDDEISNDEILALTEYVDTTSNNDLAVVAEYDNIDIINIDKKSKKIAQDLVTKITSFIIGFNDIELNEEHKKYIAEVGKLELSGLQEMLVLVEYNKSMIKNIIARINSVQAEDFAMIASYNTLINQHMKLLKELSIKYKSIPMVMKKMRIEVLCNQELDKDETNVEKLHEELNNHTQHLSNKELIRNLRLQHENKNKQ